MNKLALIALSAALSIAATASCNTAEAATLRTDTTISGDTIRLGDLFDDVMGKEDQPVGRAPAPGRRATYDATYLLRIASYHQVSWRPGSQFDRAVVTRTSSVVNAAMVRGAVEAELAARADADRLDIDLDNKLLEVHLPADQPATMKLESITFDQVQGRFSAVLVAPAEGNEQTRTAITGRAAALVEVPVLTRRVKPGEVIAASDIGYMEVRLNRMSAELLRDTADLIGQTPRRLITANTPVRTRDLQQPQVVTKGSLVTMVLQHRSMTLTAQGKALEAGSDGQVIRVVNTMSNRTVEAVVTGPNQVSVGKPVATALN
jgi:flagella basal body P-ring formation protein FlgA